MSEYTLIPEYTIQVSEDGLGYSWRAIDDSNMVGHVDQLMEIDCEIIDGGITTGEQVMSNGLLYRWYPSV